MSLTLRHEAPGRPPRRGNAGAGGLLERLQARRDEHYYLHRSVSPPPSARS